MLVSSVVLFLLIAVIFSVIMPQKYGSKSKLLVVQNMSANGDAYSFLRTNEYLTNLLSQVVLTSSFFKETLNAGLNIDKSYFTDNPANQIKIWKDTVKTSSVGDTGIINVSVKHPDKHQVNEIIAAIDETLQKKHTLYHAAGDKVEIKLIDQPAVGNQPVEPNIMLNIILGLVFGLILGMSYVYAFPENRYKLKLMNKEKSTVILNSEENQKFVEEKKTVIQNALLADMYASSINNQQQNANMPTGDVKQNILNHIYHNQPSVAGYNRNFEDDNDIDNVVKNGSMQNIFGKSNLGGY